MPFLVLFKLTSQVMEHKALYTAVAGIALLASSFSAMAISHIKCSRSVDGVLQRSHAIWEMITLENMQHIPSLRFTLLSYLCNLHSCSLQGLHLIRKQCKAAWYGINTRRCLLAASMVLPILLKIVYQIKLGNHLSGQSRQPCIFMIDKFRWCESITHSTQ